MRAFGRIEGRTGTFGDYIDVAGVDWARIARREIGTHFGADQYHVLIVGIRIHNIDLPSIRYLRRRRHRNRGLNEVLVDKLVIH